ncbi:MAG: hypothetical protein ACPLF9_08415 [Methanothermobacter tenebrarum]
MSSDDNTGCGKVALLLGAIASLIAILIFITGKQSLPEFLGGPKQEQAMSMPTVQRPAQTKVPTLSPTLRPTDTPIPNPTPTKTPIPSPTPLPDTPPGTILEFGQTWRQGGLELTMTKSGWGSNGGWMDEGGGVFTFILTNLEPYDRNFRLSSENFSAVDNFGRTVPIIPKQNVRIDEYCPSRTVKLLAHQTIDLVSELICSGLQAYALTPRIDAGDTSITELIVSVSVSNISEARWRIRIYH